MKKLLLFSLLLVILGLPKLSAQLINPDFETWTPDSFVSSARNPNSGLGNSGWWDFNLTHALFLGISPITVFQDSINPHGGKYCAMIVSEPMAKKALDTLKYFGVTLPDTNGIIYTAYFDVTTNVVVKNGIPCTSKMQSFSFWYRYLPNGLDTCSCSVGMYHFDTVTKQRELIGGGIWKNTDTTTSWTSATIPVVYDSVNLMPDTVVILFSGSSLYSRPKAHDTMYIDDANAVFTGIDNIAGENAYVHIYPNPAKNQISLAVTGQLQASHVEVYDITGKLMGTYTMHNNLLTINTQSFNTGLYLYKMYDNTGIQMNVGKFSVVK